MMAVRKSPPLLQLVKLAEMAVRNRLENGLRRFPLSAGQLLLLVTLDEMGEASAADLSRRLHILPQTMNTLLKPLDARALLSRRDDPSHRRRLLIGLSDEGRELLVAVRCETSVIEHNLQDSLGETEIADLHAGLTRLIDKL